jgi:hypothetical protein
MATVGLDIDESRKPAAIAVVRTERKKDERGKQRTHYNVWVLERLSGRPYDEAVERVAEIVAEATRQDGGKRPTLYGNVTAAGRPALGALSGRGVRAQMIPVYLTEGDQQSEEGGTVKLGKDRLVCRLQDLLQDQQLHVLDAAGAGAKELEQEPLDSLGSLMTAVGLAVWRVPMEVRVRIVGGSGTPRPFRDPRAERMIREWRS